MLQNNNEYRVLRLFFEQPTEEFQLRQISRLAQIAPPSTKKYLKELEKEGLINKSKKKPYPTYSANRDAQLFRNLKKWFLVIELTTNGFVEHIVDCCGPDAIILFGSASRGEDIENSDIDLAIISVETELNVNKYEKALRRKISPLFISNFGKLGNELKNNIVNGIILHGYLKVF
ncbi:nucleotidyltransferase domain-containing protein [Candidatus Woesearchaeota archaeon]|nr:nucleotidyltransferase domain-containing protein [Candidatus Woesearchaeota archaeon]